MKKGELYKVTVNCGLYNDNFQIDFLHIGDVVSIVVPPASEFETTITVFSKRLNKTGLMKKNHLAVTKETT